MSVGKRWLLAGMATLFALPAHAQDYPRVVIPLPPGAQTVPTGEMADAEIRRIAGGAEVVKEEDFAFKRNTTLKDMLDFAPGVFIQPRNGAESARLSIRGSGLAQQFQGSGILLLQDGIPINAADGSYEFQEIDPWLVQYAEVYRGANGLKYGANTLGGAINLITPTGYSAPGMQLRGETGSFDTWHGQASVGYTQGNRDLYATATGFAQEGFREQNRQDTGRFSSNLGWRINTGLETRFYLGHTSTEAEIPGTMLKSELFEDPERAKAINYANDYARDLEITRLANKTAWRQGDTRYASTLYARFRSLENPVFTYISSDSTDIGWRGSVQTPQGERGEWLGGVNVYYGMGNETRYENDTGEAGARILERDLSALTSETYLQYTYALLGNLDVIASTQFSHSIRRIEQISPLAAMRETSYTGFNPRIGLLYALNSGTHLYSNLSRSYEPPTLGDLSGGNDPGFKQLDAQEATTIEIGTRSQWRRMKWDIAYYHAWVQDEFIRFRFDDGTSDTINAKDATRDGIELALSGVVADSLLLAHDTVDFRLAYTWNHFRLRDHPALGDRTLPGVAEHLLRAEAMYRHPTGWSMGPNIEWMADDAPVDLANTFYAESYALLGARAIYAPENASYSFYVEGRNLLDETYIATYDVLPDAGGADQRSFYPGEGRAIYAGVRLNL